MNTTRDDRIAIALRLSTALHRMPGNVLPAPGPGDGATPGPIGHCGRDATESCGMIDPQECQVHADVPADDPELLSISGTRAQARAELKARRQGLR
jgi:hypothetical protein